MTRNEFKKAYSQHREKLSKALRLGRSELSEALDSNKFLSNIVCSKKCNRPVSIKVWMYLN